MLALAICGARLGPTNANLVVFFAWCLLFDIALVSGVIPCCRCYPMMRRLLGSEHPVRSLSMTISLVIFMLTADVTGYPSPEFVGSTHESALEAVSASASC